VWEQHPKIENALVAPPYGSVDAYLEAAKPLVEMLSALFLDTPGPCSRADASHHRMHFIGPAWHPMNK
jgi:hypothetical protein